MSAAKPKARSGKAKGQDTSLFIDGLFSSREAVCDIRSGPLENQVSVKAEVKVCDNESDDKVDTVLVRWTMERDRYVDGQLTREEKVNSCGDESFRLDEIEAWTIALSNAVQLAKKQGYLPSGKES